MEGDYQVIKPPRISEVKAVLPSTLEIAWTTGEVLRVEIGDWIDRFELLQPLRDPALFALVRVGWYGHSVEWNETIELGADQLYERSKDQTGEPSPQRFDEWMRRNRLSLTTAAEALGLSRRMVAYYRAGSRPIPKIVGLACIGWESGQSRD
jgi:hypothetical protein